MVMEIFSKSSPASCFKRNFNFYKMYNKKIADLFQQKVIFGPPYL